MTRDEFLDRFFIVSGYHSRWRTPTGIAMGKLVMNADPCLGCSEHKCLGWHLERPKSTR